MLLLYIHFELLSTQESSQRLPPLRKTICITLDINLTTNTYCEIRCAPSTKRHQTGTFPTGHEASVILIGQLNEPVLRSWQAYWTHWIHRYQYRAVHVAWIWTCRMPFLDTPPYMCNTCQWGWRLLHALIHYLPEWYVLLISHNVIRCWYEWVTNNGDVWSSIHSPSCCICLDGDHRGSCEQQLRVDLVHLQKKN